LRAGPVRFSPFFISGFVNPNTEAALSPLVIRSLPDYHHPPKNNPKKKPSTAEVRAETNAKRNNEVKV
jgi:hypothetical protein